MYGLDYVIKMEHLLDLLVLIEQIASFAKYECSKHMSLMIMKHLSDHFVSSKKVEATIILNKLVSLWYKVN